MDVSLAINEKVKRLKVVFEKDEVYKMFDSNLSKHKRYIIIVMVAIALVILWCIYMFQTRYVFMGQKIYEKDTLSIEIDCREKKYSKYLKKVNQFTKIETLSIEYYDQDNYIQHISSNKTLKDLLIYFSDVEDASFINTMSNIKLLHCLETDIDFSKISSKYINTIELISCNIKNLDMLKNCSSLRKLELYKGSYEGMQKIKDKYVLQDSSIFSEFDTISDLCIHDLEIQDISGFLNMESLKQINVSENSMTQDQISILESAGVQVITH